MKKDAMHSSAMGVVFDEMTDCYDQYLVNIIVHTSKCVSRPQPHSLLSRRQAIA